MSKKLTVRQRKAKDAVDAVVSMRVAVLSYACAWVDGNVSSKIFKDIINKYRDAVVGGERRWR